MKNRLLQILDFLKGRRGTKPDTLSHKPLYSHKVNRSIAANIKDLTKTIVNEAATNRLEQQSENKCRNIREYCTLGFVILTTIAVVYQTYIFNETMRVTKESYTRVQRAFLMVDELRVGARLDEKGSIQGWEYVPIIRNSGNTPATGISYIVLSPDTDVLATLRDGYNTIGHTKYNMVSYKINAPQDPDDVLKDPSMPMKYLIKNNIVGPQREIEGIGNFWHYHVVPSDFLSNKYIAGEYSTFIFGSIRYTDVFDQPHLTKFCFNLGGIAKDNKGDNMPAIPTRCSHWNCIDDQCKADKEAYDAKFKEESEKIRMDKVLGD